MSRQGSETRRWKNVDLRLEHDPRRNVRLILLLAAIALALAPLVTYVAQQSRYIRIHYAIKDAQDQYNRLVEQESRYLIEKTRMQSFQRVESAAPRIGLRQPDPDKVVWAGAGREPSGERVARAEP